MNILVLTVGGRPEPVVTAIRSLEPDRVVFLCSDDGPATTGSYADVPSIVAETRLVADRYDVVKIRNFDDLQDCYLESQRVLRQEREAHPQARIVADYTGGTKSMTAGLAMAAVDDPSCELNLVAGSRRDRDRVAPGTEFAQAVAVWTARTRKRMPEITNRLERFDYPGALAVLEDIAKTPIPHAVQQQLAVAIAVCRALDAWDRFAHHEAERLLQPFRHELVDHYRFLKELCRERPRDPYLLVEDLLLNAERRAVQGRYDDAVARVYRALELIAHTRLRELWEIDPSDVDLEKVPPAKRSLIARHEPGERKIQLPLFPSWQLLADDEAVGPWFRENRSRMLNWLQLRNYSILAHGLQPIDAATYNRDGVEGMRLCREALERLRGGGSSVVGVVQLPTRLAVIRRLTEADG